MAGIRERSLPAHQPPGRVMFEGAAQPYEAQIALLDANPSGPAQVAALRRLRDAALVRHGRPPQPQRPLRVDTLPARITFAEAASLDPEFVPPSPLWAMVGVGGDELAPQGLDVRDEGPGLVVAGPPRSGKSSTLLTMARWLLRQGTEVAAIIPRRSPLRALQPRCGRRVAVARPPDGDLFGVRLPPNAGPGLLGRGLLIRPGASAPVQLAGGE